jgi:hypothetical protein
MNKVQDPEASEMERENGDPTGDVARGHVLCRNCAQVPAETMQLLQGPVVLLELPVIVPESSPERRSDSPGTLAEAVRRCLSEKSDSAVPIFVHRLSGPIRDLKHYAHSLRDAYPTLTSKKLRRGLKEICRQVQELETTVDEWPQPDTVRPKVIGTVPQK